MRIMQLMDNLERQFSRAGLTVSRTGRESLSVANGANGLSISYRLFDYSSPKGGVDGKQHPFLGMFGTQPGDVVLKSSVSVEDSILDVIDSAVAAQVLVVLASLGNDICLENSDASFSLVVRPNLDHPGMGV